MSVPNGAPAGNDDAIDLLADEPIPSGLSIRDDDPRLTTDPLRVLLDVLRGQTMFAQLVWSRRREKTFKFSIDTWSRRHKELDGVLSKVAQRCNGLSPLPPGTSRLELCAVVKEVRNACLGMFGFASTINRGGMLPGGESWLLEMEDEVAGRVGYLEAVRTGVLAAKAEAPSTEGVKDAPVQEPLVHQDGPNAGRFWWKGIPFDVPKGRVLSLLEFMWSRREAPYGEILEAVFDRTTSDKTIANRASEANIVLKKAGVPKVLACSHVDRRAYWEAVPGCIP